MPNGGILSGFVEASVQLPADGLNGNCIVYYSGNYSKFTMTVKLVNGVREGEAVIVNDGHPYMRVEYKSGCLTGAMERYNESGMVMLRGHLVNGVEDGLFEEYDANKNVVWRGFYQNGRRLMEVRRKGLMANAADPTSVMSGEFYEMDENGNVRYCCTYANGMRIAVLASYMNNVMTEYDANGKRVYEGGFMGDTVNGFLRNGKGTEYANNGETVLYSGDWKNGKRSDGANNTGGHKMKQLPVIGKSRGKQSMFWVLGIVLAIVVVIIVVVIACVNNKRNPVIKNCSKLQSYTTKTSNQVYTIRFKGDSCRTISVNEDLFWTTRSFEAEGMKGLESIVIGNRCFSGAGPYPVYYNYKTDGTCRIVNCPKLQSIQIGYQSFSDYHSFELSNLPSLQSISFGGYSFYWMPSLSLTSGIDDVV